MKATVCDQCRLVIDKEDFALSIDAKLDGAWEEEYHKPGRLDFCSPWHMFEYFSGLKKEFEAEKDKELGEVGVTVA